MKFEFLWDLKINDLEVRFVVDFVIGAIALLAGILFDPIARRFLIQHSEGFGAGQILWCASWGIYLIWTSWQMKRWKE